MENLPLISVVVPCRNAEKFLKNCLTSLDNQTYKNLQIIMVDDSSEDLTYSLLVKHAETHPNYLILKTNGKGVSATRNTGINNAKGEYLAFMDCDDIIAPYHIEYLYNQVKLCNADAGVIDYKRVKENTKYDQIKFKNYKKIKTETFAGLDGLKQYLSQKKFEFSAWNKLYSKKIIDEFNVRFLEGCQYNEDSLFNYKFFVHAKKTVLTHAITYFYVQRKTSLVHLPFNISKLDAFMSLNNIIKDAYENQPEIIHYAHVMRVAITCEMLFYIKFSKFNDDKTLTKYNNGTIINKLIQYAEIDAKHIKYCKETHLYRRLLIPLVPPVAKLLLSKRRKNGGELLPQFFITDK